MTEKFEQSFKRLQVPCIVINTLKKLKTVLTSLKPPVEKFLVHVAMRVMSGRQPGTKGVDPVGAHMRMCNEVLTMENVSVIARTNRSANHLMTLEALNIRAIKPNLNTKDE